MASTTTSIPRFLLPQSGAIWRRATTSRTAAPSRLILVRFASSKSPTSPSKPAGNILAKPTRFNPPSHGARLPRGPPRHYGGDLSADEAAAQVSRDYPGMPPPKNTLAHWFIHSRWIHVVITIGTLSTLALYTMILSFRETTPHYDLLPSASDLLSHPLDSAARILHIVRLHDEANSARIEERRMREVNDVGKRAAYRRAHGLPMEYTVFGKVLGTSKVEEVIDEEVEERVVEEVKGAVAEAVAAPAPAGEEAKEPEEGKKKKKWLGIW